MSSSTSPLLLHPLPIPLNRRASPIPSSHLHSRRLLLSSPAILLTLSSPALAVDIPLFGLRKRLKNIEEKAEEAVREGEKAVADGILAAEKEVEAVAEEGIAAAEEGIVGDLVQAGVVLAAEFVGLVVGVSVVNRILGPEAS